MTRFRAAAGLLVVLVTACQASPTAPPTTAPTIGPQPTSTIASPAPATTAPASTEPVSPIAIALGWQLPTGVSRAVAFPDAGALLLAGGLTPAGTTGAILHIDLATGERAAVAHLASAVHDAGGDVLGGLPLVFGGGDVAAGTDVQAIRDGTASVIGHLPRARADLSVSTLDGAAYIVGGGTPGHPDPSVLRTTDGRTFDVVAKLAVAVRYAAVATVGGSIIVVGGSDGARDRSEIQAVDPASGSVAVIGHLPHGLSHASALVIAGRLFIAGGRARGVAQDLIFEVDPVRGTAREVGRLPRAVSDAAAVVIDGVGYLAGGEDTGFLRSVISVALG